MLPQEFLERMENMLGEEYPAFLKSYDIARYQALRLNPQKGDDAEVDQDTFAAEFEELVGSRLLSLEDWIPATERPG